MKSYWPSLRKSSDEYKTKLICEINVNESKDETFLARLKKECDETRKRVSGYSKTKRKNLLKKAKKLVNRKK